MDFREAQGDLKVPGIAEDGLGLFFRLGVTVEQQLAGQAS